MKADTLELWLAREAPQARGNLPIATFATFAASGRAPALGIGQWPGGLFFSSRRTNPGGDPRDAHYARVPAGGDPLHVAVVGPTDSVDCDCRVSRGDSLRLGYYSYTDGTGLRVTDSRGWSTRLTVPGDRRDPASGAVVVRVRRADLRPPPGATRDRVTPPQAAERRNPLGSFLPVQ